ncbi:MAG: FeoA family protein [Spirochaetales bacterium]|nr:FeoA family protein [Spirochaetales bacterium]
MTLKTAETDITYTIEQINASEEGMKDFLFTLGCFPGQDITIISKVSSNYVINIKDARYSIDGELAEAISIRTQEEMKKIV